MTNPVPWADLSNRLKHVFRRPHVGDGFAAWTLRRWYITYIMLTTAAVHVASNFVHYDVFVWLKQNADLAQAVVIGLMLIFWIVCGQSSNERYIDNAEEKGDDLAKAAESVRTFYLLWTGVLFSWLLFYVADTYLKDPHGQPWVWLEQRGALDVVNVFEAFWFLLVYIELTIQTVETNGRRSRAAKLYYSLIIIGFLAFCLFEFVHPNQWWSVGSGLCVGLSMALVVGRLESHLIKAYWLLIALLFFYAVIQLLYPLFYSSSFMETMCKHPSPTCAQADVFQNIVTIGAFPLKIIMFLTIDWLYFAGRLLFYTYKLRGLLKSDGGWSDFLTEIS